MASKFVDSNAIIQVIGTIYNNPSILDVEEKYNIREEDFPEQFHRIIFGVLYKIHELGAQSVSLLNIEDFLKSRPKSKAVFDQHKGEEWIIKASEYANFSSFDYYYNRLKKFTLLRAYDNIGVDVKDIFDPDNIMDSKKRQEQEEWLDNSSLLEIADKVEEKIDNIRIDFADGTQGQSFHAGEGIFDLIEELKVSPEYGIPLSGGQIMTTVTRGARLGKFYLRSSASGYGKSRSMAGDASYIACNEIYKDNIGWVKKTSGSYPTLFISTELDLKEMQTLFLSYISGVNEAHILDGKYEGDEEERIYHAAEILENSPLYVEVLLDFSLQDIENTVKKYIREHDVSYIFLDYIHSSLKILEEISTKTKGMKLREDNILFMLSNKMKNICIEYNVFILSATQLSGLWRETESPDQQLLRGARSIADKIDIGMIILPVGEKDLECLATIPGVASFGEPNMKLSIYKNRRGAYKGVYLWCNFDMGTCRITPLFCTSWDYVYKEIQGVYISAF